MFSFLWTLALSFLPLFFIHFYFGKSFLIWILWQKCRILGSLSVKWCHHCYCLPIWNQSSLYVSRIQFFSVQLIKTQHLEFPGGPVVRTQCFHCCDPASIAGQGTKILQASQCSQKQKVKMVNFSLCVFYYNFLKGQGALNM